MDVKLNDTVMLGEGSVLHARNPLASTDQDRSKRVSHTFRYRIFNLLIPVQNEESVKTISRIFGISVSAKDYLDGTGQSLNQSVRRFLLENLDYTCNAIWLQTLPRMFGYVFNPVSFWYCYRDENLDAVLCEVNNTFGERHFYFVTNSEDGTWATARLPKQFHVSPFFDTSGEYTFKFQSNEELKLAEIKLWSGDLLKLDTHIKLRMKPLEDVSAYYLFSKYGWMSLLIFVRIHLQAFRLWMKGVGFFRKPKPPEHQVTTNGVSQKNLSKNEE